MSDIFRKLFFISITLIIYISCNSEYSTNPPEQDFPDYYPTGIGSTLKYSVNEKDSSGNIIQSGTRNILFSGNYIYNGINYTTQDDSLDFGTQSSVSTYLVRKSETGVFYAIDTNQVALLIPDSLKQFVTLRNEMQLLFYPLTAGSSWSLYRITAEVQPGIQIKILDIIASFEGTEQLTINIDSVTVVFPSRKVSYNVEIFSEIGSAPETYSATMWYAQNTGLLKFEGNQFIIDLGGGGIGFEPSTNILTQELIEYDIK